MAVSDMHRHTSGNNFLVHFASLMQIIFLYLGLHQAEGNMLVHHFIIETFAIHHSFPLRFQVKTYLFDNFFR